MTQEQNAVNRFAEKLFEHGLEGYDPSRKGSAESVVNPGGAKIFFHVDWKGPNPKIIINNPTFKKVLSNLPVTLYTTSRIKTNEKGEPQRLKDGTKFDRTCTGLILYSQLSENPNAGKEICSLILEALRQAGVGDLSNYICPMDQLKTDRVKILEREYKVRNFLQEDVPFKLSSAVLLALPSGAVGSPTFWALPSSKVKSREGMSQATTASPAEVGDQPW